MDGLALLGLAAIIAIMAVGRHWSDWLYPWGLLATSFASIVLIGSVIRPGSLLGRSLEIAPLRWLGQRSYSIYLWHWPVVLALQWEFHLVPNTIEIVAATLIVTFALSELSYRLVETPLRRPQFWATSRWKGMWSRPRTIAAAAAAVSIAVFLALVIGFAVLPGRSPSDLLSTSSAKQAQDSQYFKLQPDMAQADSEPTAEQVVVSQVLDARTTATESVPATSADAGTRDESEAPTRSQPAPTVQRQRPAQQRTVEPERASPDPNSDTSALHDPREHVTRYVVESGDSPVGIMERFSLSQDEYVELNGVDMLAMIHPGDVVNIPCPGAGPCVYLRIEQSGSGCLSWQVDGATERVCATSTSLVNLPMHFTAEPSSALEPLPTWSWRLDETVNDSAPSIEGLRFTLSPEHMDHISASLAVLRLDFGLPPLAIGDSVMVGAQSQLENVGIEVNADVGRMASTSLEILAYDFAVNGPRDTVIFQAVGPGFVDSNGFQRLLEVTDGVRHLIVLTRQFPPREPLLSYERDINKMLRREVPKRDWVTLLDWNAITDGREDEVTWDGTHLNPRGQQLYADHILAAILSRPPSQFTDVIDIVRLDGG